VPNATRKPQELVTRAELARRGCRSRAAVTQACRPGGPLSAAVVGKRVDVRHPTVVAWLVDADGDQAALEESEAPPDDAPTAPTSGGSGGRDEMRTLLLRRRRAEAERIESRNARDAGRLISREFVQNNVFTYLNSLNIRLLQDVVTTLATRLGEGVPTVEERKIIVRHALEAAIGGSKREALRALDNCRTGDNPPPVEEHPREVREVSNALAVELRVRLPELAAEIVKVETVNAARVAAGSPFNQEIFDRVVAARPDIDSVCVLRVRQLIDGTIAQSLNVVGARAREEK
jgi:hypothetical protein